MLGYLFRIVKRVELIKRRFLPVVAATWGSRKWGKEWIKDGRRVPPIYKDEGEIQRRIVNIPGAVELEVPLSNYYYGDGFLYPTFWHVINRQVLESQGIILVNWKHTLPGMLQIETDASLRTQRDREIVVEGMLMRVLLNGEVTCLQGLYEVTDDIGRSVLYHECRSMLSSLRVSRNSWLPGNLKFDCAFDGVHVISDSKNAVTLVKADYEWTDELDAERKLVLGRVDSDEERDCIMVIVSEIAEELRTWGSSSMSTGRKNKISHEYREGLSLVDYCTRQFSHGRGLHTVDHDSSFEYIHGRDVNQTEPYLRLPDDMLSYVLSKGNRGKKQ